MMPRFHHASWGVELIGFPAAKGRSPNGTSETNFQLMGMGNGANRYRLSGIECLFPLRAPHKIIQTADSEPAITVRLQHNNVRSFRIRFAMVIAQDIDQFPTLRGIEPDLKLNLHWFIRKVVHHDNRIISPVISKRQHRPRLNVQSVKCPKADFGHLLAHSDHSLGPVEEGIRVSSLLSNIDMLK